jgi:hypothetical protein
MHLMFSRETYEWVAMGWDVLRLGCGLVLGVIIIAWNWGGYKQQSFTCDQTALFVTQDSNISTWPFCLGSFTLYLSQFIYVQNLFTIVLGIWFTICFSSWSLMLECLVICNFLVWFTYKGTTVQNILQAEGNILLRLATMTFLSGCLRGDPAWMLKPDSPHILYHF